MGLRLKFLFCMAAILVSTLAFNPNQIPQNVKRLDDDYSSYGPSVYDSGYIDEGYDSGEDSTSFPIDVPSYYPIEDSSGYPNEYSSKYPREDST